MTVVLRITHALRDAAIRWCDRLAHDRAQVAWSIRFTQAEIAATPATQVAWQEYCAVRNRRQKDTPPRILWAEAAEQLRADRPAKPSKPPRPPAKPSKPSKPPKPPKPPPPKKEVPRMAKKKPRRSISVSRGTYDRAKAFAAKQGLSIAQLTEQALAPALTHFHPTRSDIDEDA